MIQVEETRAASAGRGYSVEWARLGRDRLLALAGLDVEFVAAERDYVHWEDEVGTRRRALDLVGGAGALLLGHNHPEMVSIALRHFHDRRPLLVQGARRGPADALKRALAERISRETNRDYEVLLLSTGTEAIETALKHARLELLERQKAVHAELISKLRQLKRRIQQGSWVLNDSFLRAGERVLRVPRIDDFDGLWHALLGKNAPALEHAGHVLAAEGGFHGKTMGSLAATWNPDARLPFVRGAAAVRFVRAGDDLEAIAGETSEALYELELDPPSIVRRPFSTIIAVILEPIRGEGGVYEVEDELVREVQTFRAAHPEVPIIVDEIQCGLGRTGRFLEGVARGLPCDYITLGKAIGGGVAKLAAVAIDRTRYLPEYSLLHTSTFAEDEYSSAVGAACLATIDRDRIPERCAETGAGLRAALLAVARSWPTQIAEVRGRGMMLGLEIGEQSANPSAVLRALDEEQLLTTVIAGFLLHRHDIRILPTVGRRRVLRIEPSAYFDRSEIERVADAFREVAAILAAGDSFSLLAHLVRKDEFLSPVEIIAQEQTVSDEKPQMRLRSRVGFIGHLIESEHVAGWDPSLQRFRPDELASLLDRLSGILPPRLITTRVHRSSSGVAAELSVFGITMTAAAIERDLRENQGKVIRAQVFAAYELARNHGCSMVGFGGYTSIATMNCAEFVEDGPAVTTGNALTVGLGLEAIRCSTDEMGLVLAAAKAAVCGAIGNIGQVYASLLATNCGELLLVGRTGSLKRLRFVVAEVAKELARQTNEGRAGGLLLARFSRAYRMADCPAAEDPDLLVRVEAELGAPLVDIRDDLSALRGADLIVAASNSATPIIKPEHLASDRPVLICDVAVPADVSKEVELSSNVRLIQGGIAAVVDAPDFQLPGFPLPPGETYACAAETLVLGLAGVARDFSRGTITTAQVREIVMLARLHGFRLGSYKAHRLEVPAPTGEGHDEYGQLHPDEGPVLAESWD